MSKDEQQKHGGFVPVVDLALDLPDVPVPARRDRRRQARHFTQLDQVTQLVGACEADPELGFMARLLALCSLPRTSPGDRLQFERVNGPYTLVMFSSGKTKLPYGTLPRCSWRGSAPKRYGRKTASSSSEIRSRRSCGSWRSTTMAARCVVGSKSRCGGCSLVADRTEPDMETLRTGGWKA